MALLINNLHQEYDGLSLYRDFSIGFPEGKITCILGPSGCGKTTLLNIIGGIRVPDNGSLSGFDDKAISYIFQEPRLLPWKTVSGNIEFVTGKDLSGEKRKEQTEKLIRLVQLERFADYYPCKLSGGMRQRVAIARAFAYPSDIILMDEPLKGLDIKLKLNLIQTFIKVWQDDKRTVIFVTHDVDEAILLSDEIIVLSRPPVQIITHERIKTPLPDRTIDSESLKDFRRRLFNALE